MGELSKLENFMENLYFLDFHNFKSEKKILKMSAFSNLKQMKKAVGLYS